MTMRSHSAIGLNKSSFHRRQYLGLQVFSRRQAAICLRACEIWCAPVLDESQPAHFVRTPVGWIQQRHSHGVRSSSCPKSCSGVAGNQVAQCLLIIYSSTLAHWAPRVRCMVGIRVGSSVGSTGADSAKQAPERAMLSLVRPWVSGISLRHTEAAGLELSLYSASAKNSPDPSQGTRRAENARGPCARTTSAPRSLTSRSRANTTSSRSSSDRLVQGPQSGLAPFFWRTRQLQTMLPQQCQDHPKIVGVEFVHERASRHAPRRVPA